MRSCRADVVFVAGVGQHSDVPAQLIRCFEKLRSWLNSGGLGTMGGVAYKMVHSSDR